MDENRALPLSADELLAMPAEDYMNARQRDFFAQLLRAQEGEILGHLEAARTSVVVGDAEPDELDRAALEEQRRQQLRVVEREAKLLKKIQQALRRLQDGSYGYCLETGEAIGLPRLLARPTAELCAEAKQRQEQHERHFAKRV